MKQDLTTKSYFPLITGISSVILGFIVGGIIIIITGNNPFSAYYYLFLGAFMTMERFSNVLLVFSTLALTGLAAAFAFRTGLFNIGIAGQMFLGGFAAVAFTLYFQLPPVISQICAIIVAMAVGAAWAFIPGILKAKFKVNEVVSTIMMNWIAYWIVYYGISLKFLKGPFETETRPLIPSLTLRHPIFQTIFKSSELNFALFLAIFAIIVIWFILKYTTLGYQLKAVGFNPNASRYAGMKVERNLVYALMISGALAGLAGASYYLGHTMTMQITALPKEGMNGIAVALLGANSPIGVGFSAFFFGIIESGKGYMSVQTSIPKEISDLIFGIIIYFSATTIMMTTLYQKWALKRATKEVK